MVLLKVSYRLRAHHMAEFERIFAAQILPLINKHGLRFGGLWRTLVGEVGEYLELWEFASLSEFDELWRGLLNDPQLQEVFQITGPMVEGERFTLLEPVPETASNLASNRLQP
jgi:hypothetical protein